MRGKMAVVILAIMIIAGSASAAERVVVCEETYAEY
jgi:hypothetical protein